MKLHIKAFTIVELVITVSIISILSSISYVSIKMISESNIRNRSSDIKVFVSDLKNELMKEQYNTLYLYLSTHTLRNQYVFSYQYKNACDHITNIDTLFSTGYVYDKGYAYFTGTILSGTIIPSIVETRSGIKEITTSDVNKTHKVTQGDQYLYTLYGTGKIVIDNVIAAAQVNCGAIKVLYLDINDKNRYSISQINAQTNNSTRYESGIVLKYSKVNLKGDLYSQSISSSRLFFEKVFFIIKDIGDNLSANVDL